MWRPQGFAGRTGRAGSDVIVEPYWGGVRVIVRVGPYGARLTDEEAVDCTGEFPIQAQAIAAAALAQELVLDGYLTVHPTQTTIGAAPGVAETPSTGDAVTQMLAGGLAKRPKREPRLDPTRPIAFMAVDLLLVDGSSLLEIPLLERKRLLDGALRQSELVRITPYLRPPIGSFAATWKALGFSSIAIKPANGRYSPTGGRSDWVIAPIPSR
jgi:ATP-dependent DNA ligase